MRGTLVIVSGPSGAGKTTIVEKVVAQHNVGVRVITCTTRAPRQGEVDGKDYRFLARRDFARKLSAGKFVEHAEVYGNFYGTLASDIDLALEDFPFAFLVTDVQGAQTIMAKYPEALSIFINISRKELFERLSKRGGSHKTVLGRAARYDAETAKSRLFGVVVRNKTGHLDTAISDLLGALKRRGARSRRAHSTP